MPVTDVQVRMTEVATDFRRFERQTDSSRLIGARDRALQVAFNSLAGNMAAFSASCQLSADLITYVLILKLLLIHSLHHLCRRRRRRRTEIIIRHVIVFFTARRYAKRGTTTIPPVCFAIEFRSRIRLPTVRCCITTLGKSFALWYCELQVYEAVETCKRSGN